MSEREMELLGRIQESLRIVKFSMHEPVTRKALVAMMDDARSYVQLIDMALR